MIGVAGGTYELGEWDPSWEAEDPGAVINLGRFTVVPYCMDRFSFPGVEGLEPMTNGLVFEQLPDLVAILGEWGRRSCSIAELLLGAAGPDNWRYPYDPETRREEVCPTDSATPGPLGGFPECVSPLGFRDFMGRSSWGTIDASTATLFPDGLLNPENVRFDVTEHAWALQSGTGDTSSYYAESNFGIHTHGPGENDFWDDSFRACMSPEVEEPKPTAEWVEWLQDAWVSQGSWQGFLDSGGELRADGR